MAQLTWTRRYSFEAVHSLHTGARKERLHGHAYLLEVSFSDFACDSVDNIVQGDLLPHLHGRQLNFLENSTGECLSNWIHAKLAASPMGPHLTAVCLQETRKNRFVSAQTERRYV